MAIHIPREPNLLTCFPKSAKADNEIAKDLNTSRQAVYKIRILALKNLRNELLDLKGGIA
ncbi:hypothetical protein [Clostridium frigidicarnis]|uniref:hypothetical protein n=1 Tax=Clostridium frigidicarnis TaxID=84698 RepID=UPI000B7CCD53|nr:hypothetical protein [Clostridium frigidicarnis]